MQLVRAYQLIMRRLEQALDCHGLSLPQFEVLAHLHFDGAITQNELAHRLLVTKGNVCGLIDRMEAAGLVERTADPADRRANRLRLTLRGTSVLSERASAAPSAGQRHDGHAADRGSAHAKRPAGAPGRPAGRVWASPVRLR